MNVEDNVNLAKRVIIDNIYNSAKLEGLSVTFPETYDIINNINAHNLKPSDIKTIINLKNSWEYVLSNLDKDIDFALIKELHKNITFGLEGLNYNEVGELRTDNVGISGTLWRPSIPDINKLYNELVQLKENNDLKDFAFDIYLWICRSQMFKDGNKRLATLLCNFILIKNGLGIFTIPESEISKFVVLLVKFYETNNKKEIKDFMNYFCYCSDKQYLTAFQKEKLLNNENNIQNDDLEL